MPPGRRASSDLTATQRAGAGTVVESPRWAGTTDLRAGGELRGGEEGSRSGSQVRASGRRTKVLRRVASVWWSARWVGITGGSKYFPAKCQSRSH